MPVIDWLFTNFNNLPLVIIGLLFAGWVVYGVVGGIGTVILNVLDARHHAKAGG